MVKTAQLFVKVKNGTNRTIICKGETMVKATQLFVKKKQI